MGEVHEFKIRLKCDVDFEICEMMEPYIIRGVSRPEAIKRLLLRLHVLDGFKIGSASFSDEVPDLGTMPPQEQPIYGNNGFDLDPSEFDDIDI